MNEKLSVIIPVYNAEKYLDRCVLSVLRQTYRNLEIILVDDGSTDNSSQMCDTWSERDQRIKVIHKKMKDLELPEIQVLILSGGVCNVCR